MEIIPYILAPCISVYIGKVSYNLFSNNKKGVIDGEYNVINEKLENKIIDVNKKPLGNTLDDKIKNIKQICKQECGIDNNIKNKNKLHQRLKRYIKEYENIGHYEFVKHHKKKWHKLEISM